MSPKENADFLMSKAQEAGIVRHGELSNFMGQMQIESGGFTRMSENLGYSGRRLLQVFPGRNGMRTRAEADAIAVGGPEAVADAIYGGQWGKDHLGNTEAGDGWKFRGRGYVQLTGRFNYETVGQALGVDLVRHPELAEDPEMAARIGIHYWSSRVAAEGHELDVRAATRGINGGYNHVAERIAAADAWEKKLGNGYMPGVTTRTVRGDPVGNEGPTVGSTRAGDMPPGPDDAIADLTLRHGEVGPSVRRLQEALAALDVADGRGRALVADGVFGRSTREAVENYQLWNGLNTDGIAGRKTLASIHDRTDHSVLPRHTVKVDPQVHVEPRESASLATPADSAHSLHAMLQQIRAGVRLIDGEQGKPYDENSERISRCLLTACRVESEVPDGQNRAAATILQRVDHVVLGSSGNIFAVEGRLDNPAHRRACVSIEQALRTPVEQSDEQLRSDHKGIAQGQQSVGLHPVVAGVLAEQYSGWSRA